MVRKLTVGSTFPKNVKFTYIPYSAETAEVLACGNPVKLDVDREVLNKKVLIISVPGAFTPTCMNFHIPNYGEHIPELLRKGIEEVIVISVNDFFVISAWGKILGLAKRFVFASDPEARFSKSIGLAMDGDNSGMGVRTQRYAMVVDHGKVVYLGVETVPNEVTVSGVEAVLAHL